MTGLATHGLPTLWYGLIASLLAAYAVLDGFDLGVGALHLLARTDEERRLQLAAIGPVWDGNEVWLVAAGGALFAAFPKAYAAAFSAFYLPLTLLLLAFIARGVSVEFRSKLPMRWWRGLWDACFCAGSALAALLLGVALGNAARGIPLGPDGEFQGTLAGLLNPYSLLTGLGTLALSCLHGSLYLLTKTEGPFHQEVRARVRPAFLVSAGCVAALSCATFWRLPSAASGLAPWPWPLLPAFCVLGLANVPRELGIGRARGAFASSAAAIGALVLSFAAASYPAILRSWPEPANSLTVHNAAASARTLSIMLWIAAAGLPLALAYTVFAYRTFRGKVRTDAY